MLLRTELKHQRKDGTENDERREKQADIKGKGYVSIGIDGALASEASSISHKKRPISLFFPSTREEPLPI